MATQTIQSSMPSANGSVIKPYIGRRTGKVINIVARRNAKGFENVDDYFPDSDLENEENTTKSQSATTTSKCEVSGNDGQHTTGETVHPMSDSNVDSEPATKSRTANSLEETCSPDSVFGVTNDDVATDEVARLSLGTPADEVSIGQSSALNGERDKHSEKNSCQVLSGNNISSQTNGDGTAGSHSLLVVEDSDNEMHTTKKRLRFSISPEANEKEKSLLSGEKAITNKDQNGHITDEEDSLVVVERPKTRATKKTASHKKTTKQAKTNKRPQIESDSESSIEDICKSNDTFLTLKKKKNMTASKLDSNNNNSMSTTVLSTKPPAARENTKSKIPVRKTRSKVAYPKRNTRGNVKTTKTMHDEENSKNLEEEDDATVSKVQTTSNPDEFLTFETQDSERSEGNNVWDNKQMSVESQPDRAPRQSQRLDKDAKNGSNPDEFLTSETQGLECSEGNKVGNHKQMSEPDPTPRQSQKLAKGAKNSSKPEARAKSGKNVVKRKSQSTEAAVGKSTAKKKANPFAKPSVVKATKRWARPVMSAAKARVTKNSTRQQNSQQSDGSTEETLDKAGPIKAPSINFEKDEQSEIFDDCLAADVDGEVMEEEAGVSARKINLESAATQPTDEGDDGPRRSRRHRVPPLQYWKNERIEYERRKSGWIVKDVIINPSPQVVPRKRKNATKYVTSHAKKKAAASNFEESELSPTNVPEGLEEEVNPVGTVFNPDLMEQVKMELVHSSRMLDFQSLVQDVDDDSASLLVHKFFSQNQFGAGQLLLRPGAEKGRQHVRKDTMVFHIVSGCLLVTIQDDSFVLAKGSSFFVPHGNVYNVKNLDTKKDARLFFTQLKGS